MLTHTITDRYIYNHIRIPTLCTDACELNMHAFRFLMSLMKDSAHAQSVYCANACLYLFARMYVCTCLRECVFVLVYAIFLRCICGDRRDRERECVCV